MRVEIVRAYASTDIIDPICAHVYFDIAHFESVVKFAQMVESNPDPSYVATLVKIDDRIADSLQGLLQLLGSREHVEQVLEQLGWLDE